MNTKQIFTKTQAIAVLGQVKKAKTFEDIDIFAPVDPKNDLYKLSCDELEKKLHQYMHAEGIAGVVEETKN